MKQQRLQLARMERARSSRAEVPMEIGVDSFVAATLDSSGRALEPAKHLSNLLEAIALG